MREKRRIRKQCVGWAGAKRSPTLRASHRSDRSLTVAARLFRQHINLSYAVLLLIVVVMGGCSATNGSWFDNQKAHQGIPTVAHRADVATFNEAVAMVESQHYKAAIGKFRQVFDRFEQTGDRQRAAESLFWIGFCHEKQRRLDEARAIYLRLAKEYAGTRAASEADKRRLRIRSD